tara:strand:+ start:416 stop:601 length:186 start_codon:yes stop_codon:yes gene_type:complete
MLSTATRLRVQEIIRKLEDRQTVSLAERIYLTKLSRVSSVVSSWLSSALSKEAKAIDEDIA